MDTCDWPKTSSMKADHAAFIKENRVDLLFYSGDLAAPVETIQRKEDILIENVAVDPRFQKRGYGRKMVSHAEQLAVQACLDVVRLYTNSLFELNICLTTRWAMNLNAVKNETAVSLSTCSNA